MALILNIDTATEVASACVSRDGVCVAFRDNQNQREHAAFVHVAIKSMLEEAGVGLKDMEAFAVTSGPGSYTGLRVGMAAAKGFCYAFSKPLITVNTLEVMAKAALEVIDERSIAALLCPMIDARRMEVFAAIYDKQLNNLLPPQPVILEGKNFDNFMTKEKVVFFGSGSIKFRDINTAQNAVFEVVKYGAKNLATLAERDFQLSRFADLSYSEPNYFKDFHFTSKL